MSVQGLWHYSEKNPKTGPAPTLWVGATREESHESCAGCALHKDYAPDGKGRCYAQMGRLAFTHSSMIKAHERDPGRYSFERAMNRRTVRDRIVRFGAIGDPSAIDHDTLRRWIDYILDQPQGLSVIGYTHHWRKPENQWLRDYFMASCESTAQADEAIAMGWRPAIVADQDWNGLDVRASDDSPYMLCPSVASTRKEGLRITCGDCRLCDVKRNRQVIVFPDHGPARRRK